MTRVCPNPLPWNSVYQRLSEVAQSRPNLPKPPIPLILNGWVYSNDAEKMNRWKDTVQWAKNAQCDEIISAVPEDDFYYTEELTTSQVGPLGGPLYRSWDFKSKSRPDQEALAQALERLINEWPSIAVGFSSHTKPLGFTGAKARRLVVAFNSDELPPWGAWDSLSAIEAKRRTFTSFRQAVNAAVKPLEIDHIDFTKETPNKSLEPTGRPTPHLKSHAVSARWLSSNVRQKQSLPAHHSDDKNSNPLFPDHPGRSDWGSNHWRWICRNNWNSCP